MPDDAGLQSEFWLGGVQVDPAEGMLVGRSGSARLEPRVMAVLQVLAAHAGELVSREELLESVWGGAVVSDDALARCIYRLRHELRPLLDAEHRDPIIETLRKRGFRLAVPVTQGDSPSWTGGRVRGPRVAWVAAILLTCLLASILIARQAFVTDDEWNRIDSIAVLPFLNLTGDPDYEYLADGFSEQLSHALAGVQDLRVAARTSAFYFKNRPAEISEITDRLDVGALLEGSIRRHGETIRVTVQLVRDDGFHLWSREYDRPLADTLRLQSDIAEQVLAELGMSLPESATLVAAGWTDDHEAYDLYLRGRHALLGRDREAYRSAIDYFRRAVERDDEFALAYTGIADAYSLQRARGLVGESDIAGHVTRAIDRALELDENLAEAHASRGLYLFATDRYADAESHLRRAVELNPNYLNAHTWLALDLVYQDRFAEAIDAYRHAQQLDPLDLSINQNLGVNLLLVGRPDEGLLYLDRALELDPDASQSYRLLASWSLHYGRYGKALEWAEAGLRVAPDDVRLLTHRGGAYGQLGRWREAVESLERARELNPDDLMMLENLLSVHLARGDLEAVDRLLQTHETADGRPWAEDEPFGKPRVLMRWRMIQALAEGRPDVVIELAAAHGTERTLICSAFGYPGPRLYWARALELTGDSARAGVLYQECLIDVDRVLGNGGRYPNVLLRSALTRALAGREGEAAEALGEALDLGWRGWIFAASDPLWKAVGRKASLGDLLDRARAEMERARSELGQGANS